MKKKYRGLSFAVPLLAVYILAKFIVHVQYSVEVMLLGALVLSIIFAVGQYYQYKDK
ncbi:hypothetical protein [Pedobacter sp. BS3]|uniref:hypothetical protein n=1 Tax=Pedobacter sp. BS3 TaxID=2567937 RepID=UPI001659D781|nr:hypothetical protein [Pedobacter sp. BS3]